MRDFEMLSASIKGSGARVMMGSSRGASRRSRKIGSGVVALFVLTLGGAAAAQSVPGAAGAPPGTAPNAPPGPSPQTNPGPGTAAGTGTKAAPLPLPDAPPRADQDGQPAGEATTPVTGPITAEQVGQRAGTTSYQARASEQNLTGATARVDAQWQNYLPRITLLGSYTRLSEFTPPSVSGSGSLVGTPLPPGSVNPTPTAAVGFSFPLVLNNWVARASIAIPISDYFLRIGQSYTAATLSEDAARWDIIAARAKSNADGKVAYYTWLRSQSAVTVAEQTLAVSQAHQKDSENQFTVGNASKADVLRAQTQTEASALAVVRAKSNVVLTERQVRIAIHARDSDVLTPADSLDGTVPPAPTDLRALITEANGRRPEIKSIDKNAESARKSAEVQRAGRYPNLSAFASAEDSNPNQRRFPASQDWFPTWQAGAQITWSPNDILAANSGASDAESRAASLIAQQGVTRDGVELEVTQAYQAIFEADAAILSTQRQLESAVEGYRVARELFNNGRGTATTLIDAEIVLAQTRFDHVGALADARIARVRLDHAVGRDAK